MRDWLKAYRKDRKMTMTAVANAAGISQSYYSDIENGKRGYIIPVHTARAIALVLGFDWERFYDLNTKKDGIFQ